MTNEEVNKHININLEFLQNFVKDLFEDKLILTLNGQDRTSEWKESLKKLGITSESVESIENNKEILKREVKKIFGFVQVFFHELFKVNNFSFLLGAGTSIPFGSKSIRNIEELNFNFEDKNLEKLFEDLKKAFMSLNKHKDFETFLSFIFMLRDSIKFKDIIYDYKIKNIDKIEDLIKEIKRQFVSEYCNPPYRKKISDCYPKKEPYKIHQEFIRKILSRPYPLRRPNIFTLNYDLMFEIALDKQGIVYIDGFIGTSERIFKPESYNFDFFYPASTTEGKVSRLEKVIHLYKLHGSIDWIKTTRSPSNILGIVRKPLSLLKDEDYTNLLIYPSPVKEREILGFPYSELLRRFANIVQQPQSVLITLGYSFSDEHVNRIIYESFSIPSFNLVIVAYSKDDGEKILKKIGRDEQRVSVIAGEHFGDFKNFVEKVLPDIPQMKIEEKIKETLERLFPEGKDNSEKESNNER